MNAHLLNIDRIDAGGWVHWEWTCNHTVDDLRWLFTNEDGTVIQPPESCWLRTWWDELGSELLGDIAGPVTFPLPVRPADDWSYWDGGALVRDEVAS